jgi:hypothetical protein
MRHGHSIRGEPSKSGSYGYRQQRALPRVPGSTTRCGLPSVPSKEPRATAPLGKEFTRFGVDARVFSSMEHSDLVLRSISRASHVAMLWRSVCNWKYALIHGGSHWRQGQSRLAAAFLSGVRVTVCKLHEGLQKRRQDRERWSQTDAQVSIIHTVELRMLTPRCTVYF